MLTNKKLTSINKKIFMMVVQIQS